MRVHKFNSPIFLLCALLVFHAQAVFAQYTAEMAAGYKAGFMCSGVFVAGRKPSDILKDELAGGYPKAKQLGEAVIDYDARTVTIAYPGSKTPRLALFREGYGTFLMPPGSTLKDASMLPSITMPFPEGDAAKIPWPDGDLVEKKALPREVNKKLLKTAIADAFNGDKYKPHKTLGVVVVYKGQIIAEKYAPTWNMHTQYRSWSSAKSVTNALIGILVGQGKLSVDQPAPIPEWQGANDPRRGITIENLMHMSSGLKSTGANTPDAYWGGIDTGAKAAQEQREVEPGTRWKYSNFDTLLLVRSIKHVIGDDDTFVTFPRRALLNKIGMRHTFPEMDPYGNYILSSQMYTTPRDLARLGTLYLNDGVWNGERILPEGWVDYTVTPAPAKKRGDGRGYGAQFWLMGGDPRVPADTYTTSGSRGQMSTIIPSRDLIVARMALDPLGTSKWSQEEFVADILKAISDDDS